MLRLWKGRHIAVSILDLVAVPASHVQQRRNEQHGSAATATDAVNHQRANARGRHGKRNSGGRRAGRGCTVELTGRRGRGGRTCGVAWPSTINPELTLVQESVLHRARRANVTGGSQKPTHTHGSGHAHSTTEEGCECMTSGQTLFVTRSAGHTACNRRRRSPRSSYTGPSVARTCLAQRTLAQENRNQRVEVGTSSSPPTSRSQARSHLDTAHHGRSRLFHTHRSHKLQDKRRKHAHKVMRSFNGRTNTDTRARTASHRQKHASTHLVDGRLPTR